VSRAEHDVHGLRQLAGILGAIDPSIPWHLNAFQPRYRWRDRPPPSLGLLATVAGSAYAHGLRHVYVGNVSDRLSMFQHTRCPECHAVLVARHNYRTVQMRLEGDRCPDCGRRVPGIWGAAPGSR
jgi:pyruvate formate lyase activating enzyme